MVHDNTRTGVQVALDALSGLRDNGRHQTEAALPVNALVTAVGELACSLEGPSSFAGALRTPGVRCTLPLLGYSLEAECAAPACKSSSTRVFTPVPQEGSWSCSGHVMGDPLSSQTRCACPGHRPWHQIHVSSLRPMVTMRRTERV